MLLNISLSATSNIIQQLKLIKDGSGVYEKMLKAWILKTESAFNTAYINKEIKVSTRKQLPPEIKRKYPDVVFALQALSQHLGDSIYFDKWLETKKFLTFDKKEPTRTFYRIWYINKQELESLRNDRDVIRSNNTKYLSYTYNDRLFKEITNNIAGGKSLSLTLSTEAVLKTNGRGLFVLTKHRFKPVFDVFHFIIHFQRAVRDVFGADIIKDTTLSRYRHEREVIGPTINQIKPKDVVGYYDNATFNLLKAGRHDIEIHGSTSKWVFTDQNIEDIKAQHAKYKGELDLGYFNNNVIIVTSEDMFMAKYARKGVIYNKQLSDLLGFKVLTGYWP